MSQAQSESTTRRPLIYGIQDDNGTNIQNFALDLTPPPDVLIRTREGTSDGMNVLGIVIFSATMGIKTFLVNKFNIVTLNWLNILSDSVLLLCFYRYYVGEDGAERQRLGELLSKSE